MCVCALPAKVPGVVEHGAWVGESHPVQSQRTRSRRRCRVKKCEGPIIVFVVLERYVEKNLLKTTKYLTFMQLYYSGHLNHELDCLLICLISFPDKLRLQTFDCTN